MREKIHFALKNILEKALPKANQLNQVYEYAVFPPGKLFRSTLSYSLWHDFHPDPTLEKDILTYASALEIHHTYTLIHDDMPCMDDDDFRRNKPSTHKQFSEWQALLAGDGLLNLSYQLLHQLPYNANTQFLHKYFSYCVGVKGLILGQALDLEQEVLHQKVSAPLIYEIHILKTARLIQAALVGGYLLSLGEKKFSAQTFLHLNRLGRDIGILFQFLDDYSELQDKSRPLSSHEKDVNVFLLYPEWAQKVVENKKAQIEKTLKKLKLFNTEKVLARLYPR